jgi:hypothetical protein
MAQQDPAEFQPSDREIATTKWLHLGDRAKVPEACDESL